MAQIMIDLETLGTRPGSVIRSIGAVVFDPYANTLGATFYQNIDSDSCKAAGLTTDPDTIKWWQDQPQAARDALLLDQVPIGNALESLAIWWDMVDGDVVWSHGANFDIVLLECAYRAVGQEIPWKFWSTRCCRTILALGNRKSVTPADEKHHALADAKGQAIAVMAALRHGIKVS